VTGVFSAAALERYADCMVKAGVALRKGDILTVTTPHAHRELAIALAESGYRAGARVVEVRYDDPRVHAARIRYGAEKNLGELTPWALGRFRRVIAPDVAVLASLGESDPGVFDGLAPERVAAEHQRPALKLRSYVKAALEGRVRWSGCAWPTEYWAGQVYPELTPEKAQKRLARDLLEFCRLGPGDPPGIAGWTEHAKALQQRAQRLSRLKIERLRLRGPGTDLEVALAPGTIWRGGREHGPYGHITSPNIPTEEVFTTPQAGMADGPFRCSMPLSFHGRMIEGIAGEFRRGRLVRLEAARPADRDFLAAFLDSEPNARRLGEVALVDATSRIGRKRRLYSNTLLDENAAAHFAFGAGFGNTREAGQRRGVNRASLHLDVMIGTDDFEATATLGRGKRKPLIAAGLWQDL
jgi:aminopeptidase